MTDKTKQIDYLDEDPIIDEQKWICVSFLCPENTKNCSVRGFKFRGAFPTQELADAHAKKLQQTLEKDFHIYVGEGFKWLPWYPDPDTVKEAHYAEKELNELMKSAKEEIINKKMQEEDRRKQQIEDSLRQNNEQKREINIKSKLRNKKLKREQQKAQSLGNSKSEVDDDKIIEEKNKVTELNEKMTKLKQTLDKMRSDKKE